MADLLTTISESLQGLRKILRVGVLGLGEIAQVSHISVLNNLSEYYQITYVCDVSQSALDHCSKKVTGGVIPKTTTSPEELIASPDVDVVLVSNVNAFHPAHAILALQQNKYVLVEKPLALNYRDIDAIIAAEKTSEAKVFVAYQRRYAEAFLDAVNEVGSLDKIEYIRVRDIIGQNSSFVDQSGTFPKKHTDYPEKAVAAMKANEEEMVKTALLTEYGVEATPDSMLIFRLLMGLGVHDLSALRELVGLPTKVVGASLAFPVWTAILQYEGFPVVYESGILDVPIFDAHIEIYSKTKIVSVNYDTPYVKGLPVTMTIKEKIPNSTGGDAYQERNIRKTYEDPFTLEFLAFYECVIKKTTPKTSAVDAREDLDLIKLIMQAGFKRVTTEKVNGVVVPS